MSVRRALLGLACTLVVLALPCEVASAQIGGPVAPARAAQDEPPKDRLGRDTPRGTVLGFMEAARQESDAAPSYLNTPLRDRDAVDLVHKLYVVLDSRLPARLHELSDRPEGSLANPLKPDQDVVGTISTANGPLDIVVERVIRDSPKAVWLFSRQTLELIPEVYGEVDLVSVDRRLPSALRRPRVGGVRVFQWLILILFVPLMFRLLSFVGRPLRPVLALWNRRYGGPAPPPPGAPLPGWARLLFLAVVVRWLLGTLDLPLLERQFWLGISAFLTIVAVVWICLLANARFEDFLRRRFRGSGLGEIAVLRLVRRVGDAIVVSAGLIVALYYFGVDATAALAGVGIGGIAVALAAQKTLENVIGGLSIVFDKAVRVGDVLKVGETRGTVDSIGLRSTRIRTLDRTIVTVPNGQVANVGVETISARDKFWFHHLVGLPYSTTSGQMRTVIDGIRRLLTSQTGIDLDSVRVRFFQLGAFSLDIEIFAYIFTSDWNRFLEIQQGLLLRVMEIIEESGTRIAIPSQTLHFADSRFPPSLNAQADAGPASSVQTARGRVESV